MLQFNQQNGRYAGKFCKNYNTESGESEKMKRRVVAAMMAAIFVVSLCACSTGDGGKEQDVEVTSGTPQYADDKQIEMAAYCGPRASGYRFWNGEYGTYSKDPEEGWEG